MTHRLRTVSTLRLLLVTGGVLLVAALSAAIAVAASGGGTPPPPKPLAQAIEEAVGASPVDGVTARIAFTNTLLPSGALTGRIGSALLSGATGRLWVTNDGRGRLELQSDAGDTQIQWDKQHVTVYDASSHTEYTLPLPAQHASSGDTGAPPTLQQITDVLTQLGDNANVSGAQPTTVAGEPAYTVSVSPKDNGGLVGSLQLAWDATHGVPLRVALYARGSSSPVLALKATHISYGAVPASDVTVPVPADAKVVDLSGLVPKQDTGPASGSTPTVTGLAAVQAAAPFTVAAPGDLAGLSRTDVRLVGGKTVLVGYGDGLGTIEVVERAADSAAAGAGALASLPTVSVNGASAHELSTQLGTVLQWQDGGVSYTVAGSVTAATAETAARALR